MIKRLIFIVFSGLLLLAGACRFPWSSNTQILAKAGDKTLYINELSSVIPSGISKEDSILMAEDYIKKWVINQLMVRKAEENITLSERDIAKELEEYRNSLITYRYKNALISEKLDTIVSDQEITSFYQANESNFTLTIPLMKAIYIKIPLEVSQPERAKVFCGSSTSVELNELQEFCLRYAEAYNLYTEQWIDARQVLQNLPGYSPEKEYRLSSGMTIEERDQNYYYLVCVLGFRDAGKSAPPEFIKDNIRNLIINSRKTSFLKKLEEDIYNEGVKNKKFKLYEIERN